MQTVQINHQLIPVKEYRGKRVVTFKEIDLVHSRADGTARKRFSDNKRHFIEGEDYFVRKTDEARKAYGIAAPNGLTLITESGYLMLVKSFTDDLAWDVQRELVNSYFRPVPSTSLPSYEYAAKIYDGQPVVTTRDIEHFTGIPVKALSAKVRAVKSMKVNKDFWVLTGKALSLFKIENPSVDKNVRWIMVLNESGFKKFAKAYTIKTEVPCFAAHKQVKKTEEKEELLQDIFDAMTALKVVLNETFEEERTTGNGRGNVIWQLGFNVATKTYKYTCETFGDVY